MNENLMKLKKMLCKELEEYGSSGSKLSAGTLEVVDKLAHACKNLCKIIEAEEESEFSSRGSSRRSYADGSYEGSYDGSYEGMSSRRRRDSMGRYSRDGYSRAKDDELHEIVDQLRSMAKDLPQPTQRAIQQFAEMVD